MHRLPTCTRQMYSNTDCRDQQPCTELCVKSTWLSIVASGCLPMVFSGMLGENTQLIPILPYPFTLKSGKGWSTAGKNWALCFEKNATETPWMMSLTSLNVLVVGRLGALQLGIPTVVDMDNPIPRSYWTPRNHGRCKEFPHRDHLGGCPRIADLHGFTTTSTSWQFYAGRWRYSTGFRVARYLRLRHCLSKLGIDCVILQDSIDFPCLKV